MEKIIKNNDLNVAVNDDFAVIDFSAAWCPPCKLLAPVFHELAAENDGKASFYSVDVDENRKLADQFSIYSVPTLVILKNGKEVARSTGFRPKQALAEWIESNR